MLELQRPTSNSAAGPAVMLVEDDSTARSVLESALRKDGFTVWPVSSVGEARRLLKERAPEALVVASSALEANSLLSTLRADPATAGLPIVFLAAPDETHVAALSELVAVDAVVRKPAFGRDISAVVNVAMAVRSGKARIELDASASPPLHVVRGLVAAGASATLVLAQGQAKVTLENGRLMESTAGVAWGREALVRALALTTGTYEVQLTPVSSSPDLTHTLRELVTVVGPRLAKFQGAVLRGLPLPSVYQVHFAKLTQALRTLPDDVNRLVRLFDGRRSLAEVVLESSIDETLTLEVAARLYQLGIIVAAPPVEALIVPRAAPAFFEPLSALFEQPVIEAPAPSIPTQDWVRGEESFEVGQEADWHAEPVSAALAEGLPVDVLRQLEAFGTEMQVEKVPNPLESFARGKEAPGESLEGAIQAATGDVRAKAGPMIPLERPVVAGGNVTTVSVASPAKAAPAPSEVSRKTLELFGPAEAPPEAERTVRSFERSALPRLATPMMVPAVSESAESALEEAFFSETSSPDASTSSDLPTVTDLRAPKRGERRATAWLLGGFVAAAGLVAIAADVLREGKAPAPTVAAVVPTPQPLQLAAASSPAVVAPPPAPAEVAAAEVPTAPDVEPPTFVEIEETPPVDVTALLKEGLKQQASGKFKAAAETFAQVVAAEPDNTNAWVQLGLARYDMGDNGGAKEAVDTVLAIEPNNAHVQMLIAAMHFDSGKIELGRKALERYLELEPKGPHAQEARALLR